MESKLNLEELDVLNEIENMCFFPTMQERIQFQLAVCEPFGFRKYTELSQDDFEQAFELARSILREHGANILKEIKSKTKRVSSKKSWRESVHEDHQKFTSGGFY